MIRYLSLLALVAASCASPLDVETPRDTALDSLAQPTTVRATSIALAFDMVNAVGRHQFTVTGTAVIDTGTATPVVWLTIAGTAPAGTLGTMPLRGLTVHLDSVTAGAGAVAIVGVPSDPIGAELATQIPGTVPKTLNPDGSLCTLDLTFALDRTGRTLTAAVRTDFHPNGVSLPMKGTLTLGY